MNSKIIIWMVTLFSCISFFLLLSCSQNRVLGFNSTNNAIKSTQELVSRNSALAIDKEAQDTKKSLLGTLLSLHKNIMHILRTHTDEVVFISDPFYAVNFTGDGAYGYEEFYMLSIERDISARMYVLLEQADSNIHNVEIGLLFQKQLMLSTRDYLYIKYAKKVIVSPLLKLFAPKQYQAILDVRKDHPVPVKTVTYDQFIQDEHYISIDFTDAMYEMGKVAGEQAILKNEDAPEIHLILDVNNMRAVLYRLDAFLQGVFEISPNIAMQYRWGNRMVAEESQTVGAINTFSEDSIVYIDAGDITYNTVLQYMTEKKDEMEILEGRFFVVSYLWPEYKSARLPVMGRVEIPRDFLFQKKDNIKTVFSRKK